MVLECFICYNLEKILMNAKKQHISLRNTNLSSNSVDFDLKVIGGLGQKINAGLI